MEIHSYYIEDGDGLHAYSFEDLNHYVRNGVIPMDKTVLVYDHFTRGRQYKKAKDLI